MYLTNEEMEYAVGVAKFNLYDFQRELENWTNHNFPNTNPDEQLLGVVEELGELSHAVLKRKQGIRKGKDEDASLAEEIDAIGDLVVFLTNYCNQRGLVLQDVIYHTWQEVKKRDWQKFPKNGISE